MVVPIRVPFVDQKDLFKKNILIQFYLQEKKLRNYYTKMNAIPKPRGIK